MARNHLYGAVYALFEKEGKVALIQRANTGYHDGYYALPAGHIEPEETSPEAVVREAYEEA